MNPHVRAGAALAAGAVAGLAAGLIIGLLATDRAAGGGPSTFVAAPASSITTTGPAGTATLPPAAGMLGQLVAGFEATLAVGLQTPGVEGGGALYLWPADADRPEASGPPSQLIAFDAAGTRALGLASAPDTDSDPVLVTWELGDPEGAPEEIRVGSARWHDSAPGRLAWVGEDGELVVADRAGRRRLAEVEPRLTLTGFGSWGFALSTLGPVPDFSTRLLDPSGALIGDYPGLPAGAVDGRAVLSIAPAPGITARPRTFAVDLGDGTTAPLEWAPEGDVAKSIVWNRNRTRFAASVNRYGAGSSSPTASLIRILSADGEVMDTVVIRDDRPELAWSPDGRYLVIASRSLVFHDLTTGATTSVDRSVFPPGSITTAVAVMG